MMVAASHTLDADFRKFFPDLDFSLSDFQRNAILSAEEGNNTLALMPTGGGKSVIYWMSGLERGGVTIVVEPLIALMQEQAEKLSMAGHECLVLNSLRDFGTQMKELSEFGRGSSTPAFIFVSPERISTDGYLEYVMRRRKDDISLLTVDEIHCVSQWGRAFRPFYQQIPDFLDRLFGSPENWCPVLGLTATLNPDEIADIQEAFRISADHVLANDIVRPEIEIHIEKTADEAEKEERLWNIIGCHGGEKTVVYHYKKKGKRSVEALSEEAKRRGLRAAHFHSDMNAENRMRTLAEFRDGQVEVLFATNAFGMGMDLPDIRTVVHFRPPGSPEQYYQEIGRAGRDGRGANAYLLYTDRNISYHETQHIAKSAPSEEMIEKTYRRKVKVRKGARYISVKVYGEEEFVQCLPYFLAAGLFTIAGKGFPSLEVLSDIKDPGLMQLYDSTRVHGLVGTATANGMTPMEVSDTVYRALLDGNARLGNRTLEKYLILDVHKAEIGAEDMAAMLRCGADRQDYLLKEFRVLVDMIENAVQADDKTVSDAMHAAVGAYLVNRQQQWELGRTKRTSDGLLVRSKSEVIIADLLSAAGISYEYEKALETPEGRMRPDFTLQLPGRPPVFWEHAGMLSDPSYRSAWQKKKERYKKYFPGQLVFTTETGALAQDAQRLIDDLLRRSPEE